MAIKALVFDFGNVVAFFDHRLTTNRLVQYSSLPADAIHALLFGSPLEKAFDSGRMSAAEFLKHVHEQCRLCCTQEELATAWADIFWPNEEIIALLPRLKPHYRLLLASNTNELHTRHFCRQFTDALHHFDSLVFSHDVGACKPEALFFEHCTHRAGCLPAECLFIDDLPANIAGARAYGWQAILFAGVADLENHLATFGIEGWKWPNAHPSRVGEDRSLR